MAYIPPHKRHSKDPEKRSPLPDSLDSLQFRRYPTRRSPGAGIDDGSHGRKNPFHQSREIVHGHDCISRWFPVFSSHRDVDASMFASAVRLEPIAIESFERRHGGKPLTLFLDDHFRNEGDASDITTLTTPWQFVAGKVFPDLLSAFDRVNGSEIDAQNLEEVKLHLVARIGKVLFHGDPSTNLKFIRREYEGENNLGQLRKTFYTNVSSSYVDYVINEAAPKLELHLEKEKEKYYVKLSDKTQPDSIIFCKCGVMKDRKSLELLKIELNHVRHLVEDMSCLEKNADLRVMLATQKIVTVLTDDEIKNIRRLIDSAIVDQDAKGGLRWAFGMGSSGDRYNVIGAWHINTKGFKNSLLKLIVREADRFDFKTSTGEVSQEVVLKLIGIVSQLQEGAETNSVSDMLQSHLEMIWKHFLCHGSVA